jgi:hypothetical protein
MEDPFIELHKSRPLTTTIHNNRDIDYILTYKVPITRIGPLNVDTPASSDHIGQYIDIDTNTLFQSLNSAMSNMKPRKLTFNNVRAKREYEKYTISKAEEYELLAQLTHLLDKALNGTFDDHDEEHLQELDSIFTQILLDGEEMCSKRHIDRNPWSPQLRLAGRTLAYWKAKHQMLQQRIIQWSWLEQKLQGADIPTHLHITTCINTTREQLRIARNHWKDMKKKATETRQIFLKERAEELALQQRTTDEKALRAIQNAEESRRQYQ